MGHKTQGAGAEYKAYPFALKDGGAGLTTGRVEGFASVMGNVDDGGDVIHAGAFNRTIAENLARIKMGWQHSAPFGTTTDIYEVARADLPPQVLQRAPDATGGLYVAGQADMTAEDVDRLKRIASGSVDELSIGFLPVAAKTTFEQDKATGAITRHMREVKLFEWSPVWVAMNRAALITGLKSAGGLVLDAVALAELLVEVKDGRVLSARSVSFVDAALSALDDAKTGVSTAREKLQSLLATNNGGGSSKDTSPEETPDEAPGDAQAKMLRQIRAAESEAAMLQLLGRLAH